ncbi:hypothetical protein ES703_27582 [subsurface metagenome]
MAVVYAGVAFIVIQIIDGAFDYLKIPEWVGSLIIIMLAVGFPIAVGMAWAFDLTAEGLVRAKVKREPSAPKAPHHIVIGNKTLAIIAAVAVAVAVWSWWDRPIKEAEAVAETGLGERSIAVLPFVNFSDSKDDEYFSDGITDDILTHLSKIGDLKVIGRTSVMQYKNTTKRLRDIGRELGVATLLEGSVRRADNRVRITSQLVDAKTEEHLWAETYDRDLTDIFAIQSDVAQKIAAALKATLSPDEKSYVEEKPTDNPDAYDYYLQGNTLYYRHWTEVGAGRVSAVEGAIAMYEKAVELDPDFTLAWARLSGAHVHMLAAHESRTPERLAEAKSALDKALALDPDHPEVYLAHGHYYYGLEDWEAALEQAELGLKGQPGNSEITFLIGDIKSRQGRWKEAVAAFIKAAELDPRHVDYVINVSRTYSRMRNWAEAERFADRCIFIAPDNDDPYRPKADVYLRSKGDIEKARGVYQEALEKVGPGILVGERWYIEILARDYQKALEIIEDEGLGDWFNRFGRYITKAEIYSYMGQPEQAAAYYDLARVEQEELVENNPDDYVAHSNLGIAYAGLGRREEAIREGKLAVEINPLSKDALYGPMLILNLAEIYTLLGEQDAAIDQLEVLLSIPSELSVPLLKLDPQWDPLREHPRFKALLAGD